MIKLKAPPISTGDRKALTEHKSKLEVVIASVASDFKKIQDLNKKEDALRKEALSLHRVFKMALSKMLRSKSRFSPGFSVSPRRRAFVICHTIRAKKEAAIVGGNSHRFAASSLFQQLLSP